jgi:dTDP-4-dehydrorhamnose 3,5-epimerase-like enzyme
MTGFRPTPRRCALVTLERHVDARGVLDVAQGDALPFVARRAFVISAVPDGRTRGGHAHHQLEELLIAVRGRVEIELRASGRARTVVLDRPDRALYLPPDVWSAQRFLDDAVLVVLASHEYDPSDRFEASEDASGDIGDDATDG